MEFVYAILMASLLAIVYISITLLLYKLTKDLKPTLFLGIVLGVMIIKFVAVVFILIALKHFYFFNHFLFGITSVLLIVAGTVFEVLYLSQKKNLFM